MAYTVPLTTKFLVFSKFTDYAENNFRIDEMGESSLNGEKTLWEKEKLLVKSNSSFSYGVFKRLVVQTRKTQGLFGNRKNET